MPIGWDDLGVYMNYPKIMASTGMIMQGIGLASWQMLTGIGFLFQSPTQAFFLNQIGGVFAVIVVALSIGLLLPSDRKSFLNLPLLASGVFYSMPMVVFQQAKDMKLDPGLFFVSVIALTSLYVLLLRYRDYAHEHTGKRSEDFFRMPANLGYVFVIGVIVGLAFSIKVTTIMLILAMLAVIAYAKLGLFGFFAYVSLFIGIFTKLHLWDFLNVSYDKSDTFFLNNVFVGCLVFAIICLVIAMRRYAWVVLRQTLLLFTVFLAGVLILPAPWIAKNAIETRDAPSVSGLLNGKSALYTVDSHQFYSESELAAREAKSTTLEVSASGQTVNEDFGRYFGYESGINNYFKLPFNLTLQRNQAGEFTDITYLYFALFPAILLFIRYRNPLWLLGILGYLAFQYVYVIQGSLVGPSSIGATFTAFFGTQLLPSGYGYIAGFFLLFFLFFHFALDAKKRRTDFLFLLNVTFITLFVFLFAISSYGIVWYGISMYFAFLLAIALGASEMTYQDGTDETLGNIVRFYGSIVLLTIVGIYFFRSAYPAGFTNFVQSGYTSFKAGQVTTAEGTFNVHQDYLTILASLNLTDQTIVTRQVIASISDPSLKALVAQNLQNPSVTDLDGLLQKIESYDLQSAIHVDADTETAIKSESRSIRDTLYNAVLYPDKSLLNGGKIYRIGTFLSYFVSNNNERFFEDSLIFSFDKYFYDENPDTTVGRMKTGGLKYLLVDLNAATIDRDPRHDLTRREENLMKTFRSSHLRLIQTDSACLRMALEDRNSPDYVSLATTNSEGYTRDAQGVETTISRGQKQSQCIQKIAEVIDAGKVDEKHYSFLLPLQNYLKENPPKSASDFTNAMSRFGIAPAGWLAVFEIQ